MEKLIVTCDDIGLSEETNNASFKLFEAGLVTDMSILIYSNHFKHALNLYKNAKNINIGLHLDLTYGIAKGGKINVNFLNKKDLNFQVEYGLFLKSYLKNKSFLDDIKNELETQILMFSDLYKKPAHLTTHIQFHMAASLRNIVLELAEKYKIGWVRSPYLTSIVTPIKFYKKRIKQNHTRSFLIPDYMVPIMFWVYSDPKLTAKKINSLEGTVEIVVHPGSKGDPNFPDDISYLSGARANEIEYFKKVMLCLRQN